MKIRTLVHIDSFITRKMRQTTPTSEKSDSLLIVIYFDEAMNFNSSLLQIVAFHFNNFSFLFIDFLWNFPFVDNKIIRIIYFKVTISYTFGLICRLVRPLTAQDENHHFCNEKILIKTRKEKEKSNTEHQI